MGHGSLDELNGWNGHWAEWDRSRRDAAALVQHQRRLPADVLVRWPSRAPGLDPSPARSAGPNSRSPGSRPSAALGARRQSACGTNSTPSGMLTCAACSSASTVSPRSPRRPRACPPFRLLLHRARRELPTCSTAGWRTPDHDRHRRLRFPVEHGPDHLRHARRASEGRSAGTASREAAPVGRPPARQTDAPAGACACRGSATPTCPGVKRAPVGRLPPRSGQ